MVLATVSGVTGSSPNHQLAVPRVSAVVNGVDSRGTSCPPKSFSPGTRLVCIDRTGAPSSPGMDLRAIGTLKHDDVESKLSAGR